MIMRIKSKAFLLIISPLVLLFAAAYLQWALKGLPFLPPIHEPPAAAVVGAHGFPAWLRANSYEARATYDFKLTGHDGAIAGFDAEQLLKRLERRPLSGGGNFRSGSTPYDKLNIAVKFSEGVATAQDVRVESPTTRLTLTGTASVPSREYDLKGIASLVSASAPNAPSDFDLPFVVQGPWDDPLIFPDPESLIRRSPASAPLLEAVKDRKTRDAVRSVLERFTGGAKKAAPDADVEAPASAPAAVGDAKAN